MTIQLLEVQYAQTGKSTQGNTMGMREMQAKAYEKRDAQYLLLKAPPASGKSRALMFLALDKLHNQGIKKAIVAVPEMSIGSSFRNTNLSEHGFFADWEVLPHNNLCTDENDAGKIEIFKAFMDNPHEKTLVCTHATFRFACEQLEAKDFDDVLVAIDEFHHVSAKEDNKLGELIDHLMRDSSAHIIAMTGSYFRGDGVPILLPEDEEKFEKVTYTYYEQLNGYTYLKSLGLGYHFYQGRYLDALGEVIDPTKKTIIYIPNVNAGEAVVDKYSAVGHIIDTIGAIESTDSETGIITVRTHAGKLIKVADLVDDRPHIRPRVQAYLRNIQSRDDMDIIVALGMAKEGFDWPYCEHVLTLGYRGSMTEVVQIIGRSTRDCEGKTHAQFTNLIAQPDAADEDVKVSVNNLLKAITLSLMMEQVLAPNIKFKRRSDVKEGEQIDVGTILIDDTTSKTSDKVLKILNSDRDEITAALAKTKEADHLITDAIDPEVVNEIVLPKIIAKRYPDLTQTEIDQVKQGYLTAIKIIQQGGLVDAKDIPGDAEIEGERIYIYRDGHYTDINSLTEEERLNLDSECIVRERNLPYGVDGEDDGVALNRKFILMGEKFINVSNLAIDLIREVNPFQQAYEILSKNVTTDVLKVIHDVALANDIQMTEQEAIVLWPKINEFFQKHNRQPSLTSTDIQEKRMAQAIIYLRNQKAQRMATGG
ncbi:MAG: ATP-dependent helicase [Alcaligenaceae bacterium]|nr:ATP-dependent helicase [Alcaligenaceae bacterium]